MSANPTNDGEDAAAAAATTDEDEVPQQQQQGKRRKTSNTALYDLFTHAGVDKLDARDGRQYVHLPSSSPSFTRSILSSIIQRL
jgi:hypothetical protein